jgi:hypothetical protein
MASQTNMFPRQQLNYNNEEGFFCVVHTEMLQKEQIGSCNQSSELSGVSRELL